jgi:hypothetical protein
MKTKKQYREIINNMKRVFDEYGVKRELLDDEFYLKLINETTQSEIEDKVKSKATIEQHTAYKNIRDVKMEIMVNIDGIINQMKGTSIIKRFSFGLDIAKLPLKVFLTEAKLLIRNNDFKKSDIIVFYDDTTLRTGNRGMAITRDEIVTNTNGIFKVFPFLEMDQKPEFVVGLKRDVLRLHFNDLTYDIKIYKHTKYTEIALEVIDLLYVYAQEVKKEM